MKCARWGLISNPLKRFKAVGCGCFYSTKRNPTLFLAGLGTKQIMATTTSDETTTTMTVGDDSEETAVEAAAAVAAAAAMTDRSITTTTTTIKTTNDTPVDKAFQDLYGFPWGTTFHTTTTTTMKIDETTRILVEMLGRTSAARILRQLQYNNNADHRIIFSAPPQRVVQRSDAIDTRSSSSSKPTVHKKVQHNVKHHLHHHLDKQGPQPLSPKSAATAATTTTSSNNESAVAASTTGAAAAATAAAAAISAISIPKPAGAAVGMDQLLQQLHHGGRPISTLARTSHDWDQFKEQSGLGETLEQQADSHTAFLPKQEFLSRVDQRTFEVERHERERQRSASAASSSKNQPRSK
jgi:Bucentaur or craniofacial development